MFWGQKFYFSDAKHLRYLKVIFCHVIKVIWSRFWPSKESVLMIFFRPSKISLLKFMISRKKNILIWNKYKFSYASQFQIFDTKFLCGDCFLFELITHTCMFMTILKNKKKRIKKRIKKMFLFLFSKSNIASIGYQVT